MNAPLPPVPPFAAYLADLGRLGAAIEASAGAGHRLPVAEAVGRAVELARASGGASGKIMFIGNGGSAGIASHAAIDYAKNGNLRALAFNDASALTCLANDFGYQHVFAKQVEFHGRDDDLLVAISSSGRSANILNAARTARDKKARVLTLSGFAPDNPLRSQGDVNFYVASAEYGFVEILHLVILHAILDIHLGWAPAAPAS